MSYTILERIQKFNISLLDNDFNGEFESQKDSISVNGYVLEGQELEDFFIMLEPHTSTPLNSLKKPEAVAQALEQAIEKWFEPKIKELEAQYSEAPTGFMFSHLLNASYHRLDDGQKLEKFLEHYPVVGVLEPIYKTVTHQGRCEDGCSKASEFYPAKQFYVIEQLPTSIGGALMTYPINISESLWWGNKSSPLNMDMAPLSKKFVPSLFGYHIGDKCLWSNWHNHIHEKDDDSYFIDAPSHLRFIAGDILYQPVEMGKLNSDGKCIK